MNKLISLGKQFTCTVFLYHLLAGRTSIVRSGLRGMSTSRRATGLDTEGVAIFAEKRSIFDGQSGLPGVELSQYNAPHYHVSPQLRQKKITPEQM